MGRVQDLYKVSMIKFMVIIVTAIGSFSIGWIVGHYCGFYAAHEHYQERLRGRS